MVTVYVHEDGRERSLSEVMSFDRVIQVHDDGTVTFPDNIWAPDVYMDDLDRFDGTANPWRLMTGYTGQHGYRGPVMHASEVIGGNMAHDIKAYPGVYVAVVVRTLAPCKDAHEPGTAPAEGEGPCDLHDIAGWAVAYIHDR